MSTHERRDDWEEWLKSQLQEVEVLPRKEYMEDSLQQLLAALQEERKKAQVQRRIRRVLEGAAVAVAAVAIVYMAPHLNNVWNKDNPLTLESGPAQEAEPFSAMENGPTVDIQADQVQDQMVTGNDMFQVFASEMPLPVGETLTVHGQVNTEQWQTVGGKLRYEVEDGHFILASGEVEPESTEGPWQPFALTVEVNEPSSSHGLFILYVEQDGQRLHELIVPIVFTDPDDVGDAADRSFERPPAEAAYPAQNVQLVDERHTDPAFAAYFERLKRAVDQRDVEALKALMSPNIFLSFGGQQGYAALEDMWKLKTNPESSPIWDELEKVLRYGAMRTDEYFRAPGIRLPEGTDEYTARVIVGHNVNVRNAPSMDGEVIQQATHLLVRMPAELTRYDRPGWKAVILPSGQPGFVSEEYVYEPMGYRAVFGKENGQWTMISWVAGD